MPENLPPPGTLEEAVSQFLAGLSEEDRATLQNTPKTELGKFHFGWGAKIRSDFGLWGGNQPLIDEIAESQGVGVIHPDSASAVILQAVWERLQGK